MTSDSESLRGRLFTRRAVLRSGIATSVAAALPARLAAFSWNIAEGRPAPADRKFSSPVVEAVIARVTRQIPDPVLAAMFERCFPNTLDTTVFPGLIRLFSR